MSNCRIYNISVCHWDGQSVYVETVWADGRTMNKETAKELTAGYIWKHELPERLRYQELMLGLSFSPLEHEDGLWNAVGPSYSHYDGTRMKEGYLYKNHPHNWTAWKEEWP